MVDICPRLGFWRLRLPRATRRVVTDNDLILWLDAQVIYRNYDVLVLEE